MISFRRGKWRENTFFFAHTGGCQHDEISARQQLVQCSRRVQLRHMRRRVTDIQYTPYTAPRHRRQVDAKGWQTELKPVLCQGSVD